MVSKVSGQSTTEPPELKAVADIVQILHALGLRHAQEVHFIERGDKGGPITPELAMEIDRMIAPIPQDRQYLIHVFFGG